MKTVILIVAWNGASYINACLDSVISQQPSPYAVLVVDNHSIDDTREIVRSYQARASERRIRLELISMADNLGFTRGANMGLGRLLSIRTDCDMVVLLNQDTVVNAGWLHALENLFEEFHDVGAAGCKIYYPGGEVIQHAGGCLTWPRMTASHYGQHEKDRGLYNTLKDVDFVTGAAMALRLDSLRQVGVFDEIYSPGYYEDVDLCRRLQANGWRIMYCPEAVVTHVESASFSNWLDRLSLSHRNRILFSLPWQNDEAFQSMFLAEELDFIHHHAKAEDRRGLVLAYGRAVLALTRMDAAAIMRRFDHIQTLATLIEMLLTFRRACLALKHECIDS